MGNLINVTVTQLDEVAGNLIKAYKKLADTHAAIKMHDKEYDRLPIHKKTYLISEIDEYNKIQSELEEYGVAGHAIKEAHSRAWHEYNVAASNMRSIIPPGQWFRRGDYVIRRCGCGDGSCVVVFEVKDDDQLPAVMHDLYDKFRSKFI